MPLGWYMDKQGPRRQVLDLEANSPSNQVGARAVKTKEDGAASLIPKVGTQDPVSPPPRVIDGPGYLSPFGASSGPQWMSRYSVLVLGKLLGAEKETGGQKVLPTRGHTTGVTAKRLADTSAHHGRRNGGGKRRSKPLANHGRDGNFRHLLFIPGRVSVKLSSDKAPAVTSVTSQGAGGTATSTGGDGRVALWHADVRGGRDCVARDGVRGYS